MSSPSNAIVNTQKLAPLSPSALIQGKAGQTLISEQLLQYGLSYLQNSSSGTQTKAFEAFQKSASLDNAKGMYHLATCYADGYGTKQNLTLAVNWLFKAAMKNNTYAMFDLARCYQQGKGVEKNLVKAFDWYSVAAKMGHVNSMKNLGLCYTKGEGTKKDPKEAFKWLFKAANSGDKTVLIHLVYAFMKGIGTGMNHPAALQCLNAIRQLNLPLSDKDKEFVNKCYKILSKTSSESNQSQESNQLQENKQSQESKKSAEQSGQTAQETKLFQDVTDTDVSMREVKKSQDQPKSSASALSSSSASSSSSSSATASSGFASSVTVTSTASAAVTYLRNATNGAFNGGALLGQRGRKKISQTVLEVVEMPNGKIRIRKKHEKPQKRIKGFIGK